MFCLRPAETQHLSDVELLSVQPAMQIAVQSQARAVAMRPVEESRYLDGFVQLRNASGQCPG
jgi:hypothetical protein